MKCRWNRTKFNLCGIVAAILKMATARHFSIQDIIIYPHIKFRWYRTMLNFCGFVAAILKMVIGREFSMSGINWGHHYLPTYPILMISDNVEFLPPIFRPCFGSHFENLEVININVRNFNFPIAFYSNPHPPLNPSEYGFDPLYHKAENFRTN